MGGMRSLRSSWSTYLLLVLTLTALLVLSLQLVDAPPAPDSAVSTSTPTLAPVSTTVFALIPTIDAPEYLETEPVEIDRIPQPENCDEAWVRDVVLAEAKEGASEVKIDCHLTLQRDNTITKRLIFETSGVTMECNGARITGGDGTSNSLNNVNFRKDMIEIRSPSRLENGQRVWQRPRNITIKDCLITGSIRVWGMATNGEGANPLINDGENHLLNSSRNEGHTEKVRANAPTDILFDNIKVTAVGRNPVYFSPGVTSSTLVNSEIVGRSDAVAIYLDAESYGNTIKNNTIAVSTSRELVAIDGSSHNKIFNNWFSNLSHGGIYLYRNCGEEGVIRHANPSHNQIVNNTFYYEVYRGSNPSVYLGSRDGDRSYCNDDDGYTFGSSVSNKDHATQNVVMQNQIFVRSVSDMIRTRNSTVNSPNYIDYNHTVRDDTVIYNGLAGCYVADGYRDFIPHGTVVDVYKGSDDVPICTDYRDTCSDGELIRSANTSCELTTEAFGCSVMSSNDGCHQTAACPVNRRIVAARAACNLEWGTISDASLATIPGNIIRVLRASDAVSSGTCHIGRYSLREGDEQIDGLLGSFAVSVGCDEYDANGGDCQIKGDLYCR